MPHSKSAIKQSLTKAIQLEATKALWESPQWQKMKQVDPSMPSNCFCKLVDSLPRTHGSLLTQLRTGHAPLNKHLYMIKCSDTPVCPACEDAHETAHHFLLTCPAHGLHQCTLFYELRRGSRSLTTLLSHPKAIKHLFKYIARTGHFKATLGDLNIPEGGGGIGKGQSWIMDLLNRPLCRPDLLGHRGLCCVED